jgi:hypothetical protein
MVRSRLLVLNAKSILNILWYSVHLINKAGGKIVFNDETWIRFATIDYRLKTSTEFRSVSAQVFVHSLLAKLNWLTVLLENKISVLEKSVTFYRTIGRHISEVFNNKLTRWTMRYPQSQRTHLKNVLQLESRAVLPTERPESYAVIRSLQDRRRRNYTSRDIITDFATVHQMLVACNSAFTTGCISMGTFLK